MREQNRYLDEHVGLALQIAAAWSESERIRQRWTMMSLGGSLQIDGVQAADGHLSGDEVCMGRQDASAYPQRQRQTNGRLSTLETAQISARRSLGNFSRACGAGGTRPRRDLTLGASVESQRKTD